MLPLGQRALAGQTINFPVNVLEVYNSLPRPRNSDGVVLVQPPESTSTTVSVPCSYQTSTSSGPESASTSTNSACAHTAQSSRSTSTRNLFVVTKPLVVDPVRWPKRK